MSSPEAEALRDNCVEFKGSRGTDGHGRTRCLGKMWYAHRLAWTLANGPIPDGMNVCHECDNPPCINVGHLFLGTHADNVADMVAKGRSAVGSRHGRAKLTERDVLDIRARWTRVVLPGRTRAVTNTVALADEYKVDRSLIRAIGLGKIWVSVDVPV